MKLRIDSTHFKSYSVPSIKNQPKLSLFDLLNRIFAVDNSSILEVEDEITPDYLSHIAYGIPVVKVEGYNQPSSVLDIMLPIREHYIKVCNYNLVYACNFFLSRFTKATGLEVNVLPQPMIQHTNNVLLFVNVLFNQLTNMTVNQKKQLINAVTQDIRQMNTHAFLTMETPILENTLLIKIFNNGIQYIKQDMQKTYSNPALLQEKMKVYLKIAQKLLKKKPVVDFHGAGMIVLALSTLQNEMIKNDRIMNVKLYDVLNGLSELYSLSNNYKQLRVKMHQSSIPAWWIVAKDLHFAAENTNIAYHIEIKGKKYFELAQNRKAINKNKHLTTEYKTNLFLLLGFKGASIPTRDATHPSIGFFQKKSKSAYIKYEENTADTKISLEPVTIDSQEPALHQL